MRRSVKWALLTAGLLFLLAAAWWATEPKGYQEIPMRLTVDNVIGFNTDNTSLEMGKAPPQAVVLRHVLVGNTAAEPRIVKAVPSGELAAWTTISEPFMLGPGETGLLNVTVSVPYDATPGERTGRLRILLSAI
jgi:hypothetical protein